MLADRQRARLANPATIVSVKSVVVLPKVTIFTSQDVMRWIAMSTYCLKYSTRDRDRPGHGNRISELRRHREGVPSVGLDSVGASYEHMALGVRRA